MELFLCVEEFVVIFGVWFEDWEGYLVIILEIIFIRVIFFSERVGIREFFLGVNMLVRRG